MAVVTISIPEGTLAKYGKTKGKKIQEKLVNQLKRFEDVGEEDRVVLVTAPVRQELEKMAGHEIADDKDLLRFVSRISLLNFEGVKLTVSNSQRQRMQDAAKFNCFPGQAPEEVIKSMFEKLLFHMFGN